MPMPVPSSESLKAASNSISRLTSAPPASGSSSTQIDALTSPKAFLTDSVPSPPTSATNSISSADPTRIAAQVSSPSANEFGRFIARSEPMSAGVFAAVVVLVLFVLALAAFIVVWLTRRRRRRRQQISSGFHELEAARGSGDSTQIGQTKSWEEYSRPKAMSQGVRLVYGRPSCSDSMPIFHTSPAGLALPSDFHADNVPKKVTFANSPPHPLPPRRQSFADSMRSHPYSAQQTSHGRETSITELAALFSHRMDDSRHPFSIDWTTHGTFIDAQTTHLHALPPPPPPAARSVTSLLAYIAPASPTRSSRAYTPSDPSPLQGHYSLPVAPSLAHSPARSTKSISLVSHEPRRDTFGSDRPVLLPPMPPSPSSASMSTVSHGPSRSSSKASEIGTAARATKRKGSRQNSLNSGAQRTGSKKSTGGLSQRPSKSKTRSIEAPNAASRSSHTTEHYASMLTSESMFLQTDPGASTCDGHIASVRISNATFGA
ncbi:hypothetical protein BKA62DRAFT_120223 [Auriculariales sp. MPI-PUGE-AT-0066]|nr:hypothetical protein BKA62DRAFT_120223 [Auriculariales sp. MPI-PUGE-AT-0066]